MIDFRVILKRIVLRDLELTILQKGGAYREFGKIIFYNKFSNKITIIIILIITIIIMKYNITEIIAKNRLLIIIKIISIIKIKIIIILTLAVIEMTKVAMLMLNLSGFM